MYPQGETTIDPSSRPAPSMNLWRRWRLESVGGRHRWHYDDHLDPVSDDELARAFRFDKEHNAQSADLVLRSSKPELKYPQLRVNRSTSLDYPNYLSRRAAIASERAIHFLDSFQEKDGHWAGDYSGPLFLLPALIIASYVTDTPFSREKRILMRQYMLNHQNSDGGWGLHIEGDSTLFATALQYCALRILGQSADDSEMSKARGWIAENGSVLAIPSWGKFFMALLGVYDWTGCNSLMPEMWLLPRWLAVHPGRYWCHARMVFLPMSYCFGERIVKSATPLTKALRKELLPAKYENIRWRRQTNTVAKSDEYHRSSWVLRSLFRLLNFYERRPLKVLRQKALKFVLDYVKAEDEQTKYIDIGPVNQIINSICVWHAYGAESKAFQKHVERWDDYLWVAEDGMKMNGYNGSQLWDTAFTVQASCENPEHISEAMLQRAYGFIEQNQIREEVPNRDHFFRHPSLGGWPFSTQDHGWPISDCTAEGLKAVLKIHRRGIVAHHETGLPDVSPTRLEQAADLLLTWQNSDGGWATYENYRSGKWLEIFNASEVFGEIMIDYSWIECTSACVTALIEFNHDYPAYRGHEIQRAIRRGVQFITSRQRADGSWIGSWGVCFTYGTWFAIEALSKATSYVNSDGAIDKACTFLLEHRHPKMGWGESYKSCVESRYVQHAEPQVIQTSWALLALMAANCKEREVIDENIKWLVDMQTAEGEWPQQSIAGVFNKTCMISYSTYRLAFPLWAVSRYAYNYSRRLRRK